MCSSESGETMAQSIRIPVKREILEWVIQHAGVNLNEKWQKAMTPWLKGEKNPTLVQLEQLSKTAQVPFGYFFLKEPPVENIPLLKFRTVNNDDIQTPSRNLIDTIHDMEVKQVWLRDYRQQQGLSKNFFVGQGQSARQLSSDKQAEAVMAMLGIKSGWNYRRGELNRFEVLRTKLDEIGVTVMYNNQVNDNTRRRLDQNEFRAFALIDDYAPLIFINSNDSFSAKLFSLVHETVHVWFGTAELLNGDLEVTPKTRDPITEQRINQITENILFPAALFEKQWFMTKTTDTIQKCLELSKPFGTSSLAVAIRAKRMGFITQRDIDKLKEYLTDQYLRTKAENKNRTIHLNPYRLKAARIDKSFARDVYLGTRSGALAYSEAFELVNVKSSAGFDKLMNYVKGVN